jgi:hypothetical protein
MPSHTVVLGAFLVVGALLAVGVGWVTAQRAVRGNRLAAEMEVLQRATWAEAKRVHDGAELRAAARQHPLSSP